MQTTNSRSHEAKSDSHNLQYLLEQVSACLQGLNKAQLNQGRPVPNANSVYIIAAHVLGHTRAGMLGIACGQPMQRDRPAGFRSQDAHAGELIGATQRLEEEIEIALAQVAASALEKRFKFSSPLWGEVEPHETSIREVLTEVVGHASTHLGHLKFTRD